MTEWAVPASSGAVAVAERKGLPIDLAERSRHSIDENEITAARDSRQV
ncbi:hypothetical protein AAH991_38785 [Microbispora sp. ZYX-F-249]|uniref:Uncharacterized protein n=1 Tax=Microbispora maris TaxID=3144104 RepID=A0ABV0B2G0_9ACTN